MHSSCGFIRGGAAAAAAAATAAAEELATGAAAAAAIMLQLAASKPRIQAAGGCCCSWPAAQMDMASSYTNRQPPTAHRSLDGRHAVLPDASCSPAGVAAFGEMLMLLHFINSRWTFLEDHSQRVHRQHCDKPNFATS
jgi:hypothetical protein